MNHHKGDDIDIPNMPLEDTNMRSILKDSWDADFLDRICPKLDKILYRGEAVRFAPVSSQDAHTDLMEIKQLLEEANRGWS